MTFAQRLAWIRKNAVKAEKRYAELKPQLPVLKENMKVTEKLADKYNEEWRRFYDNYGHGSPWDLIMEVADDLSFDSSVESDSAEEAYYAALEELENLEANVEAASYDMVDAVSFR